MSTSKAMTTKGADKAPVQPVPLARMRQAPAHPGEVFREDYRQAVEPPVSQADCARRLGWSVNRLSEFELGKRSLTPENAVQLEALTGASAEFWMALQARHDLWHALQATKGKRVLVGEPFQRI